MPAHAAEFAKELFDHRGEYADALSTVRALGAEEDHRLFIQRGVYLAHVDELSRAEHRTDLLTRWIAPLTESLGALQDRLDASPPKRILAYHELVDDEDLEVLDLDREDDQDYLARGVSEAWHAA